MQTRREDARARAVRLGLFTVAAIGALAGVAELVMHLQADPLADVHAYYQAASRLNDGAPLYLVAASPDTAAFYRYPPLLAILFRPLALLPFPIAAGLWEAVVVAAFAAALWRLGLRPRTAVAAGILGLPIAWTLSIGQAQSVVTLLLVLGTPAAVALAANLKVFPALVALYWIGRGDWRSLARFAGWCAALGLVQVVLAPSDTLAYPGFLSLGQVGHVNNVSPYAWSPVLWAMLVAAGAVAVLILAPRRAGWAAAVAFSVLATPRLLTYMLSTLLAVLATPRTRVQPARQLPSAGAQSEGSGGP